MLNNWFGGDLMNGKEQKCQEQRMTLKIPPYSSTQIGMLLIFYVFTDSVAVVALVGFYNYLLSSS